MRNDPARVFSQIESFHAKGFRQKSECSCGPASLSLVSMALGFPEVPEESWISEEKKRWLSVDQFSIRGMALPEVALAAELVLREKVEILLKRAFPENEKSFQQDLELASRSDHALVLNFAQDSFTDQGYPHFSPVAGFRNGEVLIADVDPEVKEAYWVPVSLIFQAMAHINPAFGIPRGWLVLRKRENEGAE
jgi:hypothetical protein